MPSSGWIRSTSTFGLVHSTGVSRKSVNGARLNWTRISVRRRAQALAGAQVERHAGPPPVVDEQPQRDERLGSRIGGDVRLAGDSRRTAPRTTSSRIVVAVSGGTACSTLTFSSRTSSASNEIGGSMRDERQQLEHVVLHDVAQRAGLVVVGAAVADAVRLRRRSSARDRRSGGSRSARRCRWRTGTPGCSGRSLSRGSDRCDRSAIRGSPAGQFGVQRARALEVVAERLLDDDAAPAVALVGEARRRRGGGRRSRRARAASRGRRDSSAECRSGARRRRGWSSGARTTPGRRTRRRCSGGDRSMRSHLPASSGSPSSRSTLSRICGAVGVLVDAPAGRRRGSRTARAAGPASARL